MATNRNSATTCMHTLVEVIPFLVLFFCCTGHVCAQGQPDVVPYLIVANANCIYRMELNGTRVERLLCDTFAGIMALDYHYRKGYMFWTNVVDHTIKRAKLDGSNVTKIVETGLQYSAGLAVDWINDKLYWTDRDEQEIQVYDLTTGERSTVLVCNPKSRPLGLAINPFQGSGKLYWGDVVERAILTAPVGTTQGEISQSTDCPWPVTIDPLTQTVLWSDYCRFDIQSVSLNGTNPLTVLPGRVHQVIFSYGVALFQESLFWTQQEYVYSIKRRGAISVTQVFSFRDTLGEIAGSGQALLYGIKAVHPFRQPTADQLGGLALCYARGCVNGICQPSGQCSCYPGWAGRSCSISSEADECAVSSGNCQHWCINLVGSYECACLDSNQSNCTDVDECAVSNGGCDHQCTKLVGSYECSCNEGFDLDSNRRNCSEINDCLVSNGGCEHQCINLVGSYECSCNDGFILSSDERSCLDVDECAVSNGGCEQRCNNLVGSYECSCMEGFTLSNNERNCTDLNECAASNGGCEQNCINLAGSYECSCMEGFNFDADQINCIDIDECAASNGGCEQNCINLAGSYECSCMEGFNLDTDQMNCTDIDECAASNGGCHHHCINLVGSYACLCSDGVLSRDCQDEPNTRTVGYILPGVLGVFVLLIAAAVIAIVVYKCAHKRSKKQEKPQDSSRVELPDISNSRINVDSDNEYETIDDLTPPMNYNLAISCDHTHLGDQLPDPATIEPSTPYDTPNNTQKFAPTVEVGGKAYFVINRTKRDLPSIYATTTGTHV